MTDLIRSNKDKHIKKEESSEENELFNVSKRKRFDARKINIRGIPSVSFRI